MRLDNNSKKKEDKKKVIILHTERLMKKSISQGFLAVRDELSLSLGERKVKDDRPREPSNRSRNVRGRL